MVYLLSSLIGSFLGVLLITRLGVWIAGKWAAGYKRILWAYGMVVGLVILIALIGGEPTILHAIMIVLFFGFDMWRASADAKKAHPYDGIPRTFD